LILLAGAAVSAAACGGTRRKTNVAVVPGEAPSTEVAWRDSSASAEDFPPLPPFAAPGERVSYRVTIHGVEVATFAFASGEITEVGGRRAIVVQSGVQAGRMLSMVKDVSDQFTSWIDVATGRPLLFRGEERASSSDPSKETVEVRFHELADGAVPVSVQRGAEPIKNETQTVGGGLHDLNSFLVLMRSWDAAPGAQATVDVMRSRFAWRTQVAVGGYETVVTELGDMPCVRLDGVSRRLARGGGLDAGSATRQYSMWISDDADRVPVLLVAHSDYGDIRMEIVGYQAGAQRLGAVRGAR
jgi:hypothetical protein